MIVEGDILFWTKMRKILKNLRGCYICEARGGETSF